MEIVSIIAPAQAAYGDTVNVDVAVKNTWTSSLYVAVTGRYNGVDIAPSIDYLIIDPGQTLHFYFAFTMPNNSVRLHVWSFYWTGTEWYQDDYGYVDIALEVEVPPVAGTISRKELEYDETWDAIPVYNIPQGQRGLLHIWGRNDTPMTQQMGIYWFVADPDGLVVQEYHTWEAWPYTAPGAEHGFLSGRFNLDKVGKYTMWVELLMNPDDPQVVDRYIGDLCTVVAVVPEPDFRGFALSGYNK